MCDSFVVSPIGAAGMVFAKNSDRERNEAQALELILRAEYAPGAALKCTYITIPQAPRTHACLISRPFWMWGAEMGANDHGLVIGNEAMHAVFPPSETPALTGMDLLRLALERAATAAEAVDVITALLEQHGQGGNCGHLAPFYYHNGFLIADGTEAFVLETVGRWWAVERVESRRALSNAYSIGHARVSDDLAAHARASGWLDRNGRFDFAARMIDEDRDAVSFGRGRCARGGALLARLGENVRAQDLMGVLRDHGEEGEAPGWTPEHTKRRSICMHAADGARRSQTTASMVTQWTSHGPLHWVTASAAPCLSVFKPIVLGADFPRDAGPLADRFDPARRWWRHESWHRAALSDYAARHAAIATERDALEAEFAARIDAALGQPNAELNAAIATCWREADAAEARWREATPSANYAGCEHEGYAPSWRDHDQLAGMAVDPSAG